jgi:hypothetical protein
MNSCLILRQTFSAKVDSERWLILSNFGHHRWHFQIWGPDPLNSEFADLTTREAKQHASDIATVHLGQRRPKIQLPPSFQWQVAVEWRLQFKSR